LDRALGQSRTIFFIFDAFFSKGTHSVWKDREEGTERGWPKTQLEIHIVVRAPWVHTRQQEEMRACIIPGKLRPQMGPVLIIAAITLAAAVCKGQATDDPMGLPCGKILR
jgi:hypothetical protein